MTSTPRSTAPPDAATPRSYHHLIAGRARPGEDQVIARRAPGTGAVVANVPVGTARDVAEAVAAARRALEAGTWSKAPGLDRSRLLNRLADLIDDHAAALAVLDSEEAGKPLRLAEGDIAGAAMLTRYAASLAADMHGTAYSDHGADFTGLVLREPVGVVGLVTPWNFPALILSQKLPFALAAGCCAVVKPSELTTGTAVRIAELTRDAGIPAGVVNVVTGDGRTGQALCEHPGVDMVSFTGSTATGRKVLEAAKGNLKKVSLELGGKAANIVFADADLEDAVEGVVFGSFFNNGECCVSQARLLIEDAVAEEFLSELTARTRALRVGQPLERGTDVGAMIHGRHLENVLSHIVSNHDLGATPIVGGSRLVRADLADGYYVEPTILDGVTPQMPAFRDEIFGPVLTVTRFRTVDEAVSLANDVEYGLANSVWSKNVDKVLTVARALQSGTVYVNTTIDGPPTMPFGGYKGSGVGREMGRAGFEEFTELKSVNIRTGRRAGTFAFGGAHVAVG